MGTTTPATGTTLHIDGAKDNTSATPTTTEAANDVVVTSTGSVGIGTTAPAGKLHASFVTFAETPLLERKPTSASDLMWAGLKVLSTKSSNMGDGFGTAVSFTIQDDAGVINDLGAVGAIRDGADDKGAIVMTTRTSSLSTDVYERFRITNTGNVGIGTSVPAGRLHINNPTGNTTVKITNEGDFYSRLRIARTGATTLTNREWELGQAGNGDLAINDKGADGLSSNLLMHFSHSTSNVGIGTATPTEKLHVAGSIKMVDGNQGAGKLLVSDAAGKGTWTDTATALGTASSKWTNDTTNTRITLSKLSDGTTARPAGTDFVVTDAGYLGIGTATPNKRLVISSQPVSATGSKWFVDFNNQTNGGLQFGYYWNEVTSLAERVRIKTSGSLPLDFGTTGTLQAMSILDNGNVGIGNTAPTNLFEAGAVNGNNNIRLNIGASGIFSINRNNTQSIEFSTNASTNTIISVDKPMLIHSNESIRLSGNGGTDNHFFLNNAGNVGIGTTTPTSKLQVIGLVEYADDTAAGTAGLTAGAFYHTAGVVKVKL